MKNKILPIVCIFILISLIFINVSFATNIYSFENIHSGETITVPAFPTDVSFSSSNGYAIAQKNLVLYVLEEDSYFYCIGTTVYVSGKAHGVGIIDGVYKYEDTVYSNSRLGYFDEFAYFSADLYADQAKSSVYYSGKDDFFYQAPLTLAGALEQNNPVQIFQFLMKNVLVSLMVFLVGLVAFFKAWAWLKTQLRKA